MELEEEEEVSQLYPPSAPPINEERLSTQHDSSQISNKFKVQQIKPPLPPSNELPLGELTVGEVYHDLISIKSNEDPSFGKFRTVDGVIYPHIVIPDSYDQQVNVSNVIATKQSSLTGVILKWLERLNSIQSTSSPTFSVIMHSILSTAQYLVTSIWGELPVSSIPNFQSFPESPIQAFAWHPYKQIFAVALKNNSICIYDLNIGEWWPISLRHEFQKEIYCIEWKPQSGHVLAVGCRTGVCLWQIFSESKAIGIHEERDYLTPWMEFLRYHGHAPVTSISWSPDGKYIATGSPCDNAFLIWDVALGTCVPIRRFGGGITMVKWSPSGHYLFTATTGKLIRVWETFTWTCQKWSNLKAPCQSASWSPNGEILVIAVQGSSVFFSLGFHRVPPLIDGQYIKSEDISEYHVTLKNGKTVSVGGPISQLSWDFSGQRLAVTFDDDQEGSELIAIYDARESPYLDYSPIGFIRGPPSGIYPMSIHFRPNFSRGALLTACWLNGKISFFPMYYKQTQKPY